MLVFIPHTLCKIGKCRLLTLKFFSPAALFVELILEFRNALLDLIAVLGNLVLFSKVRGSCTAGPVLVFRRSIVNDLYLKTFLFYGTLVRLKRNTDFGVIGFVVHCHARSIPSGPFAVASTLSSLINRNSFLSILNRVPV